MADDWRDASTATYNAEALAVGGLVVTVSLDDEGPLRPAFFWLIEDDGVRVAEGWEPSVERARVQSTTHAHRIAAYMEARRD